MMRRGRRWRCVIWTRLMAWKTGWCLGWYDTLAGCLPYALVSSGFHLSSSAASLGLGYVRSTVNSVCRCLVSSLSSVFCLFLFLFFVSVSCWLFDLGFDSLRLLLYTASTSTLSLLSPATSFLCSKLFYLYCFHLPPGERRRSCLMSLSFGFGQWEKATKNKLKKVNIMKTKKIKTIINLVSVVMYACEGDVRYHESRLVNHASHGRNTSLQKFIPNTATTITSLDAHNS